MAYCLFWGGIPRISYQLSIYHLSNKNLPIIPLPLQPYNQNGYMD